MKQTVINLNNCDVGVTEWGAYNKPLLIFLHGLGGTALSFIEVAQLLSEQYHIIGIDLPGHGRTADFKDEDFEMSNLTKWLSSVVDYLSEGQFDLVAHSWGADLALHYVSQYPKKVKKIVCLDGGYYDKEMMYSYFSKHDNQRLKNGPCSSLENELAFYKQDFDDFIFNDWETFLEFEKKLYGRWTDLLERASLALMIKQEDGSVRFRANGNTAMAAIKGMYNSSPLKVSSSLCTKTMILQSTLPDSFREIRDLMINEFTKKCNYYVSVKQLDGTTHMIHYDKPVEVSSAIKRFLTEDEKTTK